MLNVNKNTLSTAVLLSMTMTASGCDSRSGPELATGGDPVHGKTLIKKYGCNACHVIGGVRGASGQVGPPLTNIKERSYIAGVVSNTPANLQRWIMNPTEINHRTAMPDLDVTEKDARDMAAFLYSQ